MGEEVRFGPSEADLAIVLAEEVVLAEPLAEGLLLLQVLIMAHSVLLAVRGLQLTL